MPYQYTSAMNDRLFAIREVLGKTQKQMAQSLGMSNANFSTLERNATIREQTVITICNVWNVNYDYLVHGTGPMFNEDARRQKELDEVFRKLTPPFQDLFLDIVKAVENFECRLKQE